MSTTVSIIIPVYHIEAYLPRCLDSILAQTYSNWETIVIDDGSLDASGAIADEYAKKDGRIRVVHKENGGVTSARLRGIEEATGEYIGFVDGDDYIESDMLERLLKNAESANADISHCGYRMVFPDRVEWYYNTGKLTHQPGKQGLYDLLEGSFVEPGLCCKLYRRELFEGLDSWMDRTIKINEDLLMNAFLFRKAKMSIHEDVCPYHYILRQGSTMISRINENKLKDPLRVVDILLRGENDQRVRELLGNRLVYQLINNATREVGENAELIRPWQKECRIRLRKMVLIRGVHFSKRLRVMALWAAVCPWSYCVVHKVYAHIRGTDNKYEVK